MLRLAGICFTSSFGLQDSKAFGLCVNGVRFLRRQNCVVLLSTTIGTTECLIAQNLCSLVDGIASLLPIVLLTNRQNESNEKLVLGSDAQQ